jgi:hypothetical protein
VLSSNKHALCPQLQGMRNPLMLRRFFIQPQVSGGASSGKSSREAHTPFPKAGRNAARTRQPRRHAPHRQGASTCIGYTSTTQSSPKSDWTRIQPRRLAGDALGIPCSRRGIPLRRNRAPWRSRHGVVDSGRPASRPETTTRGRHRVGNTPSPGRAIIDKLNQIGSRAACGPVFASARAGEKTPNAAALADLPTNHLRKPTP